MIKSQLYTQVRYVTEADYIIGKTIYEYDIEKANISILYWKGVIDKNLYTQLYNASRDERQVYIGKMIKNDKHIYDVLKLGIEEIRKIIFDIFNLEDFDIISIRNDAIFFISNGFLDTSKYPNIYIDNNNRINIMMKNCNIVLRRDGVYTSFYKINKQEIFFYNGRFDGRPMMDITAMDENIIALHKDYFGRFLVEIFTQAERDISNALNNLYAFYRDYINGKLLIPYYREFNSRSEFCLAQRSLNSKVYVQTGFSGKVADLDISFNEDILRQLQRIFTSFYFNKR